MCTIEHMVKQQKLDTDKLKSVVHYVIQKTTGKSNVGKTVLYKILYFADFNFYERYNTLITGETYKKIPYGPAPVHFDEIVQSLVNDEKIEVREKEFGGKKQFKYISLEEPKYSLSSEELNEIDKAISIIGSMNAVNASEYSHEDTPWKVSEMNEDLDPELVFYRTPLYSVLAEEEEEDGYS